jgi:AcrR family transcriptional regulator
MSAKPGGCNPSEGRSWQVLFAERGYDATTIAGIAEAAEAAPRTVAIYFPSKQDIALSRFSVAAESLTTALRERGPGETVTDALRRWLRDESLHDDADLKRLAGRMFAANPELNALRTVRMAAAIDEGAAAVARQLGLAAGSIGPRIAAVAAAGVPIEITDLPAGEAGAQATSTALAFLDAGIRTLGG